MPSLRLVALLLIPVLVTACDSGEPDTPLGPIQLGEADLELNGGLLFEGRGDYNAATDRVLGGASYLYLSAEGDANEDVRTVRVYLFPMGPEESDDFVPPGTYTVCLREDVPACLDSGERRVFATVDARTSAYGTLSLDAVSGDLVIESVTEEEVVGRFAVDVTLGNLDASASGDFRARR